MAPKLRSIYGGGWSPAKQATFMRTQLPEKTTCSVCSKLKATTNEHFSEKQLQAFRSAIAQGQAARNPMGKWIECRTCVSGVVVELQCAQCDVVKGLSGFTKAQRKDPDNARCRSCVADVQESDPVHDEKDWQTETRNRDNDETDEEDETSNIHEDSSFASESAGGAPLPRHDLNELTHANVNALDRSTGVQSSKIAESLVSITATSNNDAAFVGYDAQGNPHRRFRTPPTVDRDIDDYPNEPVNHGGMMQDVDKHMLTLSWQQFNRSNFAKVRGTKGKPAAYRPEKTVDRTVALDDYDDDEVGSDDSGDYFAY